MKFGICTTLFCAPSTTIDLPIKSWEEIKEWFIKWDVLHYTIDGKQWHEAELNNSPVEEVEWKRPVDVRVFDPNTSKTIAEKS